jgi:hypothetical protein
MKREQGLTLPQEIESILETRKSNNKPSTLEIKTSKTLEPVVVEDKESNQCPSSCHTHLYFYVYTRVSSVSYGTVFSISNS